MTHFMIPNTPFRLHLHGFTVQTPLYYILTDSLKLSLIHLEELWVLLVFVGVFGRLSPTRRHNPGRRHPRTAHLVFVSSFPCFSLCLTTYVRLSELYEEQVCVFTVFPFAFLFLLFPMRVGGYLLRRSRKAGKQA